MVVSSAAESVDVQVPSVAIWQLMPVAAAPVGEHRMDGAPPYMLAAQLPAQLVVSSGVSMADVQPSLTAVFWVPEELDLTDCLCLQDCPSAFCPDCIKRNIGEQQYEDLVAEDNNDKWCCYKCDPSQVPVAPVHSENPSAAKQPTPQPKQTKTNGKHWSEEEDAKLAEMVIADGTRGNDWATKAAVLGTGRTAAAVMQHALKPPFKEFLAKMQRASKRASKRVVREGMVDITQPGLSFAQPKGGIAAP